MKLVSRKSKVIKPVVIIGKPDGNELLQTAREIKSFDILDKAVEMQKKCEDVTVSVNSCSVLFGDDIPYVLKFDDGNSNWRALLTKHSISQFGFRYGISSSYIQRCTLADLKGLVCENFNEWISHDNGKLLIRKYHSNEDYVRGILSTRYKQYDTCEIMKDITSSVVSDWEVKQYLLSPERFHLRLVSGEKLNVAGEDLFVGLNVDSSDVGRSSINLQLIIFRQVCSNGLILPYSIGSLYRQIHLGEGAEKFPDRIAAKLNEVAEIKSIAEQMINHTMGKKLPFDLLKEEELLKFRQSTGVTKSFMDKVIELYHQRNYSKNARWNLINCMTEVAQGYDIDLRLQFERAAGSLLVAA